jgi:four helix bundle protein
MDGKARNFREYKVWQDAVDFAALVYEVTSQLPWFEKKGLCDQLQRAVVSISSNIAEGAGRPSDSDFAHYLDMALGSTYEVETQLIISNKIGYIDENKFGELYAGIQTIERQLLALIRSIRTPQP